MEFLSPARLTLVLVVIIIVALGGATLIDSAADYNLRQRHVLQLEISRQQSYDAKEIAEIILKECSPWFTQEEKDSFEKKFLIMRMPDAKRHFIPASARHDGLNAFINLAQERGAKKDRMDLIRGLLDEFKEYNILCRQVMDNNNPNKAKDESVAVHKRLAQKITRF